MSNGQKTFFSRLQEHTNPALKWSGTYFSMLGSFSTAFLHIFCVLKRSRIPWNAFGMIYTTSLHISWVIYWSGTNNSNGLLCTAWLHVLCFKVVRNTPHWFYPNCLVTHFFLCLKWSGTTSNKNGSLLTVLLHVPCVLKWSGTCVNEHRSSSTALLHMSCVLKWSGTCINEHGSSSTALLQISCVLKWSGTCSNEHGFSLTDLLHMSCVLKWSGIWLVMFILIHF